MLLAPTPHPPILIHTRSPPARPPPLQVDNLVRAHILAAEALGPGRQHAAAGQAYFISDGQPVQNFEFFRPLVEGLGYRLPTLRLPVGLVYWVAFLIEMLHAALWRLHNFQPLLTRAEVLKTGESRPAATGLPGRAAAALPALWLSSQRAGCMRHYQQLAMPLQASPTGFPSTRRSASWATGRSSCPSSRWWTGFWSGGTARHGSGSTSGRRAAGAMRGQPPPCCCLSDCCCIACCVPGRWTAEPGLLQADAYTFAAGCQQAAGGCLPAPLAPCDRDGEIKFSRRAHMLRLRPSGKARWGYSTSQRFFHAGDGFLTTLDHALRAGRQPLHRKGLRRLRVQVRAA